MQCESSTPVHPETGASVKAFNLENFKAEVAICNDLCNKNVKFYKY
jgi:hypothetical protein